MAEAETIAKLVTNIGLGAVFVGVVIWLVIKYAPKLADSHTSMVDSVKTSNARMAEATEKLTESMLQVKDQGRHCQTTNDALLHHCDAMEHLSTGHTKEREIQKSVGLMRSVLTVGRK